MSRDYRALLRDRKTKGSKNNTTHDFCLDPGLIDDLEDARSDREAIALPYVQRINQAKRDTADRMSGPVDTTAIEAERDAACAELDARIAELEQAIRDVTVTLHFRADSAAYARLITEHAPDEDDAHRMRFMDALVAACFVKVTDLGGEPVDLAWSDIVGSSPSFGELDLIRSKVYAANRVSVDIPFSLRPSGKTPTGGRR